MINKEYHACANLEKCILVDSLVKFPTVEVKGSVMDKEAENEVGVLMSPMQCYNT